MDHAYRTFMLSLAGVFIFIGIALNLMLLAMVIQPVTKLSKLVSRHSCHRNDLRKTEFPCRVRAQIGDVCARVWPGRKMSASS